MHVRGGECLSWFQDLACQAPNEAAFLIDAPGTTGTIPWVISSLADWLYVQIQRTLEISRDFTTPNTTVLARFQNSLPLLAMFAESERPPVVHFLANLFSDI